VTSILNPDNRLFTLARQGRCPPSALVAIAVVFVVLALVLIPGQMLARIVIPLIFPGGGQSIARPIVENIVGFLPVYLALWVWLRWSSKRPFWSLGLENRDALRRVLRGALIAGLMMAVTAGLSIAPGASLAPGLLQTMGLAALGIRFLSLLAYFVQGPAEEVLFRGWLLPVIGARYRPWIGVSVSSLIFSLAHSGSPGITPLGFLNLFLFGAFAAVYALAEDGLWGICAWHAVWNWAMGDLLGFATDGTPHSGLLSSIRADGPGIITGGAFGLEGGLACTAVFLIAIGIIAMRTRRSGEGRLTAVPP
jgi:CAAX protease family protein